MQHMLTFILKGVKNEREYLSNILDYIKETPRIHNCIAGFLHYLLAKLNSSSVTGFSQVT